LEIQALPVIAQTEVCSELAEISNFSSLLPPADFQAVSNAYRSAHLSEFHADECSAISLLPMDFQDICDRSALLDEPGFLDVGNFSTCVCQRPVDVLSAFPATAGDSVSRFLDLVSSSPGDDVSGALRFRDPGIFPSASPDRNCLSNSSVPEINGLGDDIRGVDSPAACCGLSELGDRNGCAVFLAESAFYETDFSPPLIPVPVLWRNLAESEVQGVDSVSVFLQLSDVCNMEHRPTRPDESETNSVDFGDVEGCSAVLTPSQFFETEFSDTHVPRSEIETIDCCLPPVPVIDSDVDSSRIRASPFNNIDPATSTFIVEQSSGLGPEIGFDIPSFQPDFSNHFDNSRLSPIFSLFPPRLCYAVELTGAPNFFHIRSNPIPVHRRVN
jgi:hypothetical protein